MLSRNANGLVLTEKRGESSDARENIIARRPCEQCSMYHICPAECQIQLLTLEDVDDLRRKLRPPGGRRELGDAVGSGLPGVDQRDHGLTGKRRLDLAVAGHGRACLARQRKRASRRLDELPGYAPGETRQHLDRLAEAALK